tara:strand:- start:526 stop:795 length:270 start_codon:yes stop_codon:yes gene_type:complete
MDALLLWAKPLIEQYSAEYPWLSMTVYILGCFRLFFKPLMLIASNAINLSKSSKDDALLDKVLAHKAYKAFSFFVDWIASVKLPKKEEK